MTELRLFVEENTLSVNISRLREKLEEILFHFQSGMTDSVSDVEETRESRLVSELSQILRRTSLANIILL